MKHSNPRPLTKYEQSYEEQVNEELDREWRWFVFRENLIDWFFASLVVVLGALGLGYVLLEMLRSM